MFCPQCGLEHVELRKFCNRCGTNLDLVTRALTGVLAATPDDERRLARRRILARGFLYFSIGPAFGIFCMILREILQALNVNSAWILERVALLGPFVMLLAVLWTIYQFIALGTRRTEHAQAERTAVVAPPLGGRLQVPVANHELRAPNSVTEATTYSLAGESGRNSGGSRGEAPGKRFPAAPSAGEESRSD